MYKVLKHTCLAFILNKISIITQVPAEYSIQIHKFFCFLFFITVLKQNIHESQGRSSCIVKPSLIIISCFSAKLQHCYFSEADWLLAVLPSRIPVERYVKVFLDTIFTSSRNCTYISGERALVNTLMHVVLDPCKALPDSLCTNIKITLNIVFSTATVAPVL